MDGGWGKHWFMILRRPLGTLSNFPFTPESLLFWIPASSARPKIVALRPSFFEEVSSKVYHRSLTILFVTSQQFDTRAFRIKIELVYFYGLQFVDP